MGFRTYTCPIAAKCGGCEWLAVPYPIQLRRKQEAMEELFSDLCREQHIQVSPIVGMEEPLAYRNKAATPFAPGPHGHIKAGFYARGTHKIVACPSCLVEYPQCREVLHALTRAAEKLSIPAYQEDNHTGVLRHAIVRVGYSTGQIILTIVTNGDTLPRAQALVKELRRRMPNITTIVQNINNRKTNAMLGFTSKTLFGPGVIFDKLLGCTFEIGPTSFYQTNPQQTEALYQIAIDALKPFAAKQEHFSILDAYCGIGSIGICAARQITNASVIGVEKVGGAISCAKRNAVTNKLAERVEFMRADATEWMNQHESDLKLDAIILDPPRTGSTPQFLEKAAHLHPQAIVYISCNPITQKRDVSLLLQYGYKLESLVPVDMFPHTKHVETVCLLTHKG